MDKEKIFKSIEKMVSKNKLLSNVETEEKDVGYFIYFTAYSKLNFNFHMRKGGNICVLRMEGHVKPDDEADPNVIAGDIVGDDENIRYTLYADGKIVFQRVIPFEEDDAVEDGIKTEVKAFVNMFINNAEMLDCDIYPDTANDTNIDVADFTGNEKVSDEKSSEETYGDDNDDDIEDIMMDEEYEQDKNTETVGNAENKETEMSDSIDEDLNELDYMLAELERDDPEIKKNSSVDTQENNESIKDYNNTDIIADKRVSTKKEKNNAVSNQIDQMYAEMESIFNEREKALGSRETKLNKVSAKLKEKEQRIEETEKDLETQRANLRAEVEAEFSFQRKELEEIKQNLFIEEKRIEMDKRKAQAELATIESRKKAMSDEFGVKISVVSEEDIKRYKKELDEANKKIDSLQSEVTTLRSGVSNTSDKTQVLEKTVEKQKNVIEKFKKKKTDWEHEKKTLMDKINELQNQSREAYNPPEDMISVKEHEKILSERDEKLKSLENKIRDAENTLREKSQLEKRIELLMSEKDQLDKDKQQAAEELKNLKDKLEEVELKSQKEAEQKKSVEKEAQEIINDIKSLGITMEVVPGNGEMVLLGNSGNCTVCVNVEAGMAYVQKDMKKPAKYADTLEKWNAEDIRFAYYASKDKIVCKCKYESAAKAVNEIIGRFNPLS